MRTMCKGAFRDNMSKEKYIWAITGTPFEIGPQDFYGWILTFRRPSWDKEIYNLHLFSIAKYKDLIKRGNSL